MFKERVMNTALTTEEANNFFKGRIFGDGWSHDDSFVATLRALFDRRLPDGEYISLRAFDCPVHVGRDDFSKKFILDEINIDWLENTLYVINVYDTYSSENAVLDSESIAPKTWKSCQRVEKVTAFFHKVMGVLCYINPETKTSIVVVERMNIQKFHYLQCGSFAFLPWYFDTEAGCTEDEMAVLNSLREKTPDKYREIIAKIAEVYDFEKSRIERMLKGFETRFDKKQRDQLVHRIDEILDSISNLDRRYREFMQEKRDCEIRIFGLDKKILDGSEDNEILDYFLHNRSIILKSVDDNYMEFVVSGYLDSWSPDMADSCIKSKKSYVYYNGYREYDRAKINSEEMGKLMTAIFIDEKLKIRICGAFRFTLGVRVEPMNGYYYGEELTTYMPNPHIDQYGCMGDYLRIINDMVKSNDYIMALEQTSQSAKSLNFGDSTVLRSFMANMYSTDRKFIETPDGKVLSQVEAVKWLKENEASEKGEVDG